MNTDNIIFTGLNSPYNRPNGPHPCIPKADAVRRPLRALCRCLKNSTVGHDGSLSVVRDRRIMSVSLIRLVSTGPGTWRARCSGKALPAA